MNTGRINPLVAAGHFIMVWLVIGSIAYGQPTIERKVFSSGGGTGTSGLQQYAYTFGEPLVGTDMSNLPILTKGFHQPLIQNPLYAKLESFTAQLEGENAQLEWEFAGYPYPAEFTIERSMGEEEFQDIETYVVDPDAQLIGTYQHVDRNVIQALENRATYRIRMRFPDGTQAWSHMEELRWEHSDDLQLLAYPNPVSEQLHILFTNKVEGTVEVYLLNALGQRVYSERNEMGAGSIHHQLDMRRFPGGIYVLAIQRADQLEELMIRVVR